MKILFYQMSYLDYDLELVFKEKGIEYKAFSWKFEDNNHDDKFLWWFDHNIDTSGYDALFSIDYWPLISEKCQEKNLPYIAWSYDTPPNVRNIEETLGNPVNHVFWFDRTQYQKYRDEGFDTVYHMPLGVNRTRLGALHATKEEHARFDTEISLVGKLYDSDYLMLLAMMSDTYQNYMNTLIDTQGKIFNKYIIDEMITPGMVADINQYLQVLSPRTDFYIPKEALTYAAASEVTKRERIILLTLCGARYQTRFYSYQDNEIIKNVERYPAVNYVTEMPLVFQCSKINLNPAFCMIESGASLRALDIMGAGGFLLTRHQQELSEMYKDGEELVIYKDYQDAIDKVTFYMEHKDLRQKIARKGREKTLEEHSLQGCIDEIFRIAEI